MSSTRWRGRSGSDLRIIIERPFDVTAPRLHISRRPSMRHGSRVALTDPEIESLVAQHWHELARFEKTATFVAEEISRRAREEALRHLLSFRAKHPDDLRGKLARKRDDDERYAFANLRRDLCAVVTDLAVCRLVAYNWHY